MRGKENKKKAKEGRKKKKRMRREERDWKEEEVAGCRLPRARIRGGG